MDLIFKIKNYINSFLPLKPDIEKFSNTVVQDENITDGNSFRGLLSALDELLQAFKEVFQTGFQDLCDNTPIKVMLLRYSRITIMVIPIN